MKYNFDYAILEAINNAIRTVKAAPLMLGATRSGVGGPIGGFVGYLPQNRVSFDTVEAAVWDIPVSGISLMTNLDRIRYRLSVAESGIANFSGGGSGGGADTFLDLFDTPSTYSGSAGMSVIVNVTEDGLEFSTISGSAGHIITTDGTPVTPRTHLDFDSRFTVLDNPGSDATVITIDAVESVTGDGVNNASPTNPVISWPTPAQIGAVDSVTGDGVDNTDPNNPVLTFPTPSGIGAVAITDFNFLELTDTPNTYSGSAGRSVVVNPTETGLIFTTISGGSSGVSTFLSLTDTPSTYSGFGGHLALVKRNETGLEFSDTIDANRFIITNSGGMATTNSFAQINMSGYTVMFGGDAVSLIPSFSDSMSFIGRDSVSVSEFLFAFGDSVAPYYATVRGRGTKASPSGVQLDDVLGRSRYRGYTNEPILTSTVAEIRAVADGNFVAGSVPTRIEMWTVPSGSTTLTKAMTVTRDGNVNIESGKQYLINGVVAGVPSTRTVSTTAPLTGGGDLSADRTLAISAATSGAAGSMSAADKTKIDTLSTRINKSTDQTRNSTITLAADSALQFSMAASTKYWIRVHVFAVAGATPDIKFSLDGPASPTVLSGEGFSLNPNATRTNLQYSTYAGTALSLASAVANGKSVVRYELIVHNGSNSGTFSLQWAQNTSDPADTTVYAGSYLEYIIL